MDIGSLIAESLAEYTEEVKQELEVIKEDVADETVDYLIANSPKGRRGKYAKGWRKKKDGTGYIVHNSTDYQLTHILEKGHAKKSGGRTQAQPHIIDAERVAIESMEKRTEEAIKS
ncbi:MULTISPECIES: HK97 gp10 family phage protein [unclassified Enterococcus]|uniref:HK97 gp10 family phage protein n=1 Tax=unclassified Enterococcus TaxID=2608891 RepID=UPI001552BA9F|nr:MULTISPECIES: HK97 gp10 family phage protein [unclassified Enterococcus]MBS7578455.1 HK97 gp10 family phage protein [Enterococcus sp. MMGLQ5-2]MBS7585680.1 HK97 gp10 family phage protein [Enterococcus sp. MMGLQ5-1]NPD13539.1 HK97 gp10 family phage protein [Enterococcus sp. MMGLQ5-1]NPD38287.1 HK97 gp10 family phage protein [Enterococcus sp. MMGLQ5-2]